MLSVYKFGGTSLATPSHIRSAADRIARDHRAGRSLVVVVSAMGHTTDHLIRIAHKTVTTPARRELDMLLTSGERISMSLLAMALEELGIPAISFTGSQSGIVTDDNHGEAQIVEIRPLRIQEALLQNRVVIIAGFQGVSPAKEITTLGRGGSDTTAVALAAALKADDCVVFTDVDGLMTADPRIVTGTRLISGIGYDEALELATLGAKMHPRSLDLARRYGVRLNIRCSFTDSPGTMITEETTMEKMEKPEIRGIATEDGFIFWEVDATLKEIVTILEVLGSAPRIFQAAPRSISFLCRKELNLKVQAALNAQSLRARSIDNIAVVSAVGHGVGAGPDLLPRFLKVLEGVETLLMSSNALSISAAIRSSELAATAERLHRALVR